MARKRGGEEAAGDSWMNTYADMVTLLLTFFVVLLSLSNTDTAKMNAFISAFSNIPDGVVEQITGAAMDSTTQGELPVVGQIPDITAMDKLYIALSDYVEENQQAGSVQIFKVDNIIYIRFNDSLLFEPNQYVLRSISTPTMQFIGDGLKQNEDSIRMVNVIGHTATIDNGTYWMLSGERAAVVATFFNSNCNFDPQKLTIMGYGNQYPIATNDTEEGRMKNRRVELIVVGNESDKDFNIYDTLGEFYDSASYPTSGSAGDVFFPNETGTGTGTGAASQPNVPVSTPPATATSTANSAPPAAASTPPAATSAPPPAAATSTPAGTGTVSTPGGVQSNVSPYA